MDYAQAMNSVEGRGKPVDPKLKKRLADQLRSIFAEIDIFYPEFEAWAKSVLVEHVDDNRFPFVIQRLWMESTGEIQGKPDDYLRDAYARFVESFDWSCPRGEQRLSPDELHRALSVWQREYVLRLRTKDALEIIQNSRRILLSGEP